MDWKTLSCFVDIRSPWVRVIGEELQDHQGQILEYWRVEKADSVVIITLQDHHLILPPPAYRPGLGQATFDFPGGRVSANTTPLEAARGIIQRELGIGEDAIASVTSLNTQGWPINSSFSNQKLYGVMAQLSPKVSIPAEYLGARYPTTVEGVNQLLVGLSCLQCRSVLLEWWHGYHDKDNLQVVSNLI